MSDRHPLIDGERIRALRLAAGLSQRELAPKLNLSQTAVRSMEDERNLDELSVRQIRRLAEALGVHPLDLTAPRRALEPDLSAEPKDGQSVVAMLAHHGDSLPREQLARALAWTLTRLDDACAKAHQQLDATGLRIVVTGTGQCRLEPRRGTLTASQLKRLAEASEPPRLTPHAYELLLRLRRFPPRNVEQTLSTARDRRAFAALLAHHIVNRDGTPVDLLQ